MEKVQVRNVIIEYLRAEQITQAELVERLNARLARVGLDCDATEVSKWTTGARLPSYSKMIIVYLISADALQTLAGNILAALRPEIWGKHD